VLVVVPLKIEALLLLDDNVDGRKQKNPEASVRTGRDAKRLKEAKITRFGISDDLTSLSLLHRTRSCERRWGHCRMNGVLEVVLGVRRKQADEPMSAPATL